MIRSTGERPDFPGDASDRLDEKERARIAFVRRTFEPGRVDASIRFLQRTVGSGWIQFFTRNTRHVYGFDRLPPLDAAESYVCVANHRSFFDLYTVTSMLVAEGLPHRIVFPVRANFFYTHPLGLFVNGAMSFFAMYPPVFRERERAALNLASIDETVWLLRRGGVFCGLHPEGTRNKGGDPYELLPAQSGVGRIIHQARVKVIPVFVNGLGNDFPMQLAGDLFKFGPKINIVFGAPVDFGGLLDEKPSPRVFKRVSERSLEAIAALGQEEKAIRAAG